METYLIEGTDREVGAIGIFEDFRIRICAETSQQAYEEARTRRYELAREHVLIQRVSLCDPDSDRLTLVEPRAYLP